MCIEGVRRLEIEMRVGADPRGRRLCEKLHGYVLMLNAQPRAAVIPAVASRRAELSPAATLREAPPLLALTLGHPPQSNTVGTELKLRPYAMRNDDHLKLRSPENRCR